jgi:glycosyltransferase involved in cell wall biosynthesis
MKSARKKVLFVMPNLGGGGAERVIVTLLRHLDCSCFEPHLALLEAAGPFLKEVPADVQLHDLKAKRVRHAFLGIIRLSWKLKPQVIHSAMCELNLAMVWSKPFLPPGLRLLMREDSSPSAQNAQGRKHPLLWNWLYREFYPRADKIICVGDYVLDDLAENFGIARRKMTRIYNPVDIDRTRRLAEVGSNPYCGKGPHLVSAGRLSREKGADVLLDAMAGVRATISDADLTLLGEGPLKPDLLEQRDRLGLNEAVHLIGFQPNPFPYFKHADLFVLPSRFEGLPLVVLEALAVGTPVVASDCPGALHEILRDCPRARLVPPSDPKALAEGIVAAAGFAAKKVPPDQGLDAFLSRFDVKTLVRDYEQILHDPQISQISQMKNQKSKR